MKQHNLRWAVGQCVAHLLSLCLPAQETMSTALRRNQSQSATKAILSHKSACRRRSCMCLQVNKVVRHKTTIITDNKNTLPC